MNQKRNRGRFVMFVATDDAGTNRVIAEDLAERAEESIYPNRLCADGVARNLWECPSSLVRRLAKNRRSLGLKFSVFYRRGTGPIKHWLFSFGRPLARVRKSV